MEYINERLDIRFTLPDRPTVGQQLRYRGHVFATGTFTDDVYLRYWAGFLGLFEEWTSAKKSKDKYKPCDFLPDPKEVNFETQTDMRVTDAVMWAGNTAAGYMMSLDELPKNS